MTSSRVPSPTVDQPLPFDCAPAARRSGNHATLVLVPDASLPLVLERRWFDEEWVRAVLTFARGSSDPNSLLDALRQAPDPFHEMLMLAARCAREVQDARVGEGLSLELDALVDELSVMAVSASTRDRRRGAEALGTLAVPGVLSALRRLLDDEDHEVQAAAVVPLASLEDQAALEALLDALGRFVGDNVVRALVGKPGVVDRVLERLHEQRPAPGWRGGAARVLAASNDPRAVEALTSLVADADPTVRRAAVNALWAGGEEFAPLLVSLLDDADEDVAAMAASCLGRLGGPRAGEVLADAARRHWRAKVRVAAVRGLGPFPTRSASSC